MTRAELDAIRARADEHHRIPTVMAADRRDLLDYVDKLLAVIERCAIECSVRELTLLGGGDKASNAAEQREAARSAPPAPAPAAGGDPYNDDIPFTPAEYRSLA